jgi:glycosyltransferase involved in cell wall biosynthesis
VSEAVGERTGTARRGLDIGVFGARGIPSTYSGYETFLTTLLPRLADRGHRVTMYCRAGEVDGEGPFEGVRRVVLPAIPGKSFNTLSHGAVAAVRARVARHQVLLVVNVANAPMCGLNSRTGQPVLLNTDGQEWLRGKWGPRARSYFHLAARSAGRCATGLVSDCVAMADVYEHEFGAPSTVIPYCFPTPSFTPDPAVPAAFDVEEDRFHVIAGRLNPENNIDAVARAYASSDAALPLLVLGVANYDSPVQRHLDELAAADDRIRLVGHVSDRPTFLSLLATAAAYVHAHSVGGMNPSLVEAMGAGALVVALDTPFNRETLGTAGRYFAPGCGDVADVLGAALAASPAERAGLREAAQARVGERFGVDEVVSAYEEALQATAAAGRRRGVRVPTRWQR